MPFWCLITPATTHNAVLGYFSLGSTHIHTFSHVTLTTHLMTRCLKESKRSHTVTNVAVTTHLIMLGIIHNYIMLGFSGPPPLEVKHLRAQFEKPELLEVRKTFLYTRGQQKLNCKESTNNN